MGIYNYFMKCGHRANAETIINDKKQPYCIICNCSEIADKKPDLTGRKAKCSYCRNIIDSSFDLPFFKYRENKDTDSFYDGCMGWD